NDAGECGAVVGWIPPFFGIGSGDVVDNCGPGFTLTSTANPGDFFPVGTTTVTYTATDAAGNSASCSFDVTVTDDELPVVNCPADITQDNDAGICGAVVTYSISGTDNCPGETIIQTAGLASGSTFPVGTTTNTYLITDAAGNSSTCSFEVTVNDTELPTVDCSNIDGNRDADPGLCTFTMPGTGFDPASFADNCSATIENDYNSSSTLMGATFPVGSTPVVWTVTDASGNTTTCSITLVISDTQDPVVSNCPTDIVQDNDLGVCEAVVNWTAPTAADNCTNVMTSSTANPGDVFPVGTTTVTYTFTDDAGNTSICSFDVTVEDNEAPVVSDCPTDLTQDSDAGVCEAVVTWTVPTATDNCGITNMTASANPGDTFPVGTTTVTYTWTDAAGNTSVCAFDVTVEDNEAPIVSDCPTNIAQTNDAGVCGAIVSWTPPTATDNCGITNMTASANPGDSFPVGTTTVTYAWTDAAGNSSVCSFVVSVTDDEDPVIAGCPTDISVDNAPNICGNTVTWTAPTATDNCSQVLTSTHNPGDFFPVGTTTVTYTSVDPSGNTATCSFEVTVNDTQAPLIVACPTTQTFPSDPGACSADVLLLLTPPTVFENCGAVTVSFSPPGPYVVGVTPVSATVVDAAGNSAVCTFDVLVFDNEDPVFDSCPGDQNFDADPGQCGAAVFFQAPIFSDNCGIANVIASHQPGDVFPTGTTQVVYIIQDGAGRSAQCTFLVTVNDNEAPIIATTPGGPANGSTITVTAPDGFCESAVDWIEPGAVDNCGLAFFDADYQPLDVFPVGQTLVTYLALDAEGNSAVYTFTVEVLPGNGAGCVGDVTITAKAFLEGPYNGLDMDDDLRDGGQLPLNSPYGGSESVSPLVIANDDQVVDWIEVSLRNDPVPGVGSTGEDIIATRAGLLLRDGSIVELDGVSPLTFFNIPSGNYYVVVNHRNHLGLSTDAPVAVSATTPMIDFTDPATATYGGIFDGLNIGGVRVMVGGDADGDGQVVAADRNAVWNARNTAGYLDEDINMDIVVTAADRAVTSNNAFFVEFLP
ncbi:MAG: HYR domain-containing protein, partial [Bacteroidota bacterium]